MNKPTTSTLNKSCKRFKQGVQYLDEVAVLGIKEVVMSKGMCASA